MTKNKNKKSSEAAKQEAFKLSDGICYCKTPEKMIQEGKDVEVILYEGLDHGFFDRLGRLPQTADCIEEIARRVKEM